MSAAYGPLRLGLIGVDSPHAPSFTELFGDGVSGAVRGATIRSAWRGVAAPDFPLSRDRIDGFAEQVAALGVAMRSSPEQVAEESDALLIVASDARTHPDYFARLAHYGKPVFVDTRFAPSVREAHAMLEMAAEHGCLPLAGSPKRFTPEFAAALPDGDVTRIDVTGPLPTQPGHPGLAWYGVHQVDLVVAALGPGCSTATATADAGGVRVELRWADGRVATLGGAAEWSAFTTGRVESADGVREFSIEAGPAMLTGVLEAIVSACETGVSAVPSAEIIETIAIIEAANRSLAESLPVHVLR